MKNTPVGEQEAADLQKFVARILIDAGNPQPPLDLRVVRELLKLDRRFYSLSDPSLLQEVVHRVKMGGRQILKRPAILFDVVRKAQLSALWVPDGRRIFIDSDIPSIKHRWMEAHEIGHSVTPWHARFLFGDAEETLQPTFHDVLEREANYAAGQLLFLQDRFKEEALALPRELRSVLSLSGTFGNTKTSTLWRYAEEAHGGSVMVAIVSCNPARASGRSNLIDPCRYCVESPAFRARFRNLSELELFNVLRSYCRSSRGGPLGAAEVVLADLNGDKHLFHFESWSNTHEVLSLGVWVRSMKVLMAV